MRKLMILALILASVGIAHANCGNDNGNGNGCSDEQGPAGPQGPIGPQGPTGPTGTNGSNGANGSNGVNGKAGINGLNGKDANVETRAMVGVAVRVASERYFDVDMYTDYDSTFGKVGFFGARIVFKPGKSYEQRLIEKLEKELKESHLLMVPK